MKGLLWAGNVRGVKVLIVVIYASVACILQCVVWIHRVTNVHSHKLRSLKVTFSLHFCFSLFSSSLITVICILLAFEMCH